MADKEKLIAEIMKDLECTREEAEEVAEMEVKAKQSRHYETSTKVRKSPTRKADLDKRYLMEEVQKWGAQFGSTLSNPERSIDFVYNGNNYTLTLTKHRQK